MERCDILITATGNLSREVVGALSLIKGIPIRVMVGARNIDDAAWLALSGNARAAVTGSDVSFSSCAIPWQNSSQFADLLEGMKPAIVLHLASLQSPWSLNDGSEWSALVKEHGFGITAFRQAELLLTLLDALQMASVSPIVINGCYPDVCNQLVSLLGYSVFTGIGNIAILDAVLRAQMSLQAGETLKMIGHHYHIAQLTRTERTEFPEVWVNDARVGQEEDLFTSIMLPGDAKLNSITGSTVAVLLKALITGEERLFNLPGPLGLPGGYPVRIAGRDLSLALPEDVVLHDVVDRNIALATREGIQVTADGIFVDAEVATYWEKSESTLRMVKEAGHLIRETNKNMLYDKR